MCDREEIPFSHDPNCPRTDCELPGGAACAGGHESTVHDMWRRAARNPATPVGAAVTLAGDPSMQIRWALAERTDLPEELYERLADDTMPGVRWAVAANPAIGERLLRRLATGAQSEVRRGLALHPQLPLDLLADLAKGLRPPAEPLPRISAATPSEVAELAASPHAGLRMLVARRRDLPAELREALSGDADAKVAKSVASHPGLSEERLRAMVARHGVQVLAQVAANPGAPGALLADLARHEPPVRRAFREISRHPNATGAALLPCLDDEKYRHRAAAHPALPAQVVAGLLTHESEETAGAAAANSALPRAEMEELIARAERGTGTA